MTKGYHNYRGRGRKRRQQIVLAAVLVAVILAAAAFLVIQNYIVYDDAGKAHIEWPFRKEEPQPDQQEPGVPDGEVTIDYVDTGYAPHLETLHAQMLETNILRQDPQAVLDSLTENAFAVETKRVNGSITYTTAVEVPQQVDVAQYDTMANLQTLLAGDAYSIARMSVFCDSYFVRAYPDAAMRVESGSFWYDAASMAWLDPTNPQVLVYITTLCQEYAQLGFDEIALDYFSYPTAGRLDSIAGLEGVDKVQVLTDFVQSLRAGGDRQLSCEINRKDIPADVLSVYFDKALVCVPVFCPKIPLIFVYSCVKGLLAIGGQIPYNENIPKISTCLRANKEREDAHDKETTCLTAEPAVGAVPADRHRMGRCPGCPGSSGGV